MDSPRVLLAVLVCYTWFQARSRPFTGEHRHTEHCPAVNRTRARDYVVTTDIDTGGHAGAWYQSNWEPHVACLNERRLGNRGDGGKWLCDPDCMLREGCVVVSIGSNNEFSFELAMLERGCSVHTFDHTVANAAPPPGVHFYSLGLGVTGAVLPLVTFEHLLEAANVSTVDVLKMDIEGGEYPVLADAHNLKVMGAGVRQLLVEFHWAAGVSHENPTAWMRKVARSVMDAGFVVFHKEPNILWSDGWQQNRGGIEYALLNHRLI